ncbi:fucose-binding lectin II [Acidovorax sp. GBBC 3334]|uniref:fucose-binding lectin II n=1 Tax=unclassified Acidovorax TaxID=2684926 RepID=UPI0023042D5C|nr:MULTISPECIES: fucose-binding lectin II [unclassified Acidovorax]MDA8457177.1 fucose-binding lectin II [Acidovorax sp. GBBC 3334]MDA8521561.1 fucose-binding lectin II [Acidovorax sp. NCPPB 4044]
MTWSVNVINNTGGPVISPANSTLYVQGTQAVIFVQRFGYITLLDIGHQNGGPHYWCVSVTTGGYTNRWWYDGQGACDLVLNPDGTFNLSGQGQTLHGVIGGGTDARFFDLPPSHRVYLTGVTNALWNQRVTLTVNGGGPSLQWVGAGEGNRELAHQTIDTPPGPAGQNNAAVIMEHANNGSGAWVMSNMSGVGKYGLLGYNLRMVVSEDGADQDYNDSGLACQWWMLP